MSTKRFCDCRFITQSELSLLLTTKDNVSIRFRSKEGVDRDAYLGIIDCARTEQSFQGIVSWNKKSSKIHKKFAGNVEEDKEKVDADEAEKGVDLWHRSLLFEVVEHGIFGQLYHSLVSTLFRREVRG